MTITSRSLITTEAFHVSCSAHDATQSYYCTGSLAPALLQCSHARLRQSLLRRRCGRALPLHLPHRRPWHHAPRGAIHRLPIIRHDHAPATWQPSLELSALRRFLRSVAVPVGENTSLFLNSSCVCPEPVLAKRSFLCKMVPEKGVVRTGLRRGAARPPAARGRNDRSCRPAQPRSHPMHTPAATSRQQYHAYKGQYP